MGGGREGVREKMEGGSSVARIAARIRATQGPPKLASAATPLSAERFPKKVRHFPDLFLIDHLVRARRRPPWSYPPRAAPPSQHYAKTSHAGLFGQLRQISMVTSLVTPLRLANNRHPILTIPRVKL